MFRFIVLILRDLLDLPPDMASFPDPNRIGGEFCEKSLDCKRLEYCTLDGRCTGQIGCGLFGEPPKLGGEDRGCVIDEFGIGRLTGAE